MNIKLLEFLIILLLSSLNNLYSVSQFDKLHQIFWFFVDCGLLIITCYLTKSISHLTENCYIEVYKI
jgi:hypothetical protein